MMLLFFDLLPRNVLENIAGYLSHSPRAENWLGELHVYRIVTLLRIRGEFPEVMESLCTKLYLHSGITSFLNRTRRSSSPLATSSKRSNVISALGVSYLCDLVSLTGKNLTSIEVAVDWAQYNPFLLNYISSKCTNVRSLQAAYNARPWLKRFGTRLEILTLGNVYRATFVDMTIYCTQLRELRITNLRAALSASTSNPRFWRNVGDTLEVLMVGSMVAGTTQMTVIRKYCRKLNSIEIRQVYHYEAAYMDFIASYGSQVKYAGVFDASHKKLEKVVRECPNAKFKLYTRNVDLHASLQILGNQLEESLIDLWRFNSNLAANSWKSCTDLRTMEFGSITKEHAVAIMTYPKPLLKSLRLFSVPDVNDLKVIMDEFGAKTGAIEELIVRTRGKLPKTTDDTFVKFVRNNKQLKYVHISDIHLNINPTDAVLSALVRSFMKAPMLRELDLFNGDLYRNVDAIHQICRVNRHRNIIVYVFRVYYMK